MDGESPEEEEEEESEDEDEEDEEEVVQKPVCLLFMFECMLGYTDTTPEKKILSYPVHFRL